MKEAAVNASNPFFGNLLTVDEEITSFFLTVGIPAHLKGYQYLREGVKIMVENRHSINNITQELYPAIALRF